MLNILGNKVRYCDGVSRRSFLKIGTFAFGGAALTLADLNRAEAQQGTSSPHKALINIYLGGGPAHMDMWDIKTEAPSEFRGQFNPISTNVPGIQIGEVFQRLSGLMDRSVVIRSLVGAPDRHDAILCQTGWPHDSLRTMGGRPSIGATVARVQGPVDPAVPPFVGLARPTQHMPWGDCGQHGFLGPAFGAFKPDGPGMANMTLNGITTDQLADRQQLLTSFDNLQRDIDNTGMMNGMDAATQQAMNVLTSSKLINALNIEQEPQSVRDRYGDGRPYQFQFDGAPTVNDQLLMARRLVEAGARVVTLTYGRWDSHSQTFNFMRDHGGKLDQCLSALIEDLDIRGMLNDVTVIAWGEFGRTPRVNNNSGRDHWPTVSCAFMAGGGMRTGQAIGATNRLGERADQRPVQFGEVFATLYQNLGISPTATILDSTGRPQHVANAEPMRELV